MEKETVVYRKAYGIVKNIVDDTIEVLLQYNPEGESKLCSMPLKFWKDVEPSLDQHVEISWNPQDKITDPEIREIPHWFGNIPTTSELNFLKDQYGLDLSSKILFVIGPNPPRGEYSQIEEELRNKPEKEKIFNRLKMDLILKTAGWGECLALTYLIPLLKYLGGDDISFKLCEALVEKFNPKDYSDYSIFFLGSTKSNLILKEFYWERFGLNNKYEFTNENTLSVKLDNHQFGPYKCDDRTYDKALNDIDSMYVKDYFIVAKLPNPYSEKAIKPNCFIVAGIGTIGTGYAGVVLSTKKGASFFSKRFKDSPFVVIGSVDMQGMLNPEKDPVSIIFDGNSNEELNELLLPRALTAPKIWSIYSDEDFQKDVKKLG